MDAAYRSSRRFPGHTDAELEAAIGRVIDQDKRAAMVTELAARQTGTSKPFSTPQLIGGKPIVGRFRS